MWDPGISSLQKLPSDPKVKNDEVRRSNGSYETNYDHETSLL